uniref:Zinc finger CCCH-type containing 8 n=1 Tax=Aotus nancymaae TaxID=37293 RepID=A0A2K5CHR4_AOTNA
MDFENLFSKPPNPALGKTATDSDERIVDEIDVARVEETQEEKSKQECKQISKKFRHFGNSTISPKSSLHRKSRSKDYDVYSDKDICNQEPEDNFAKELQQYIQAREMANAAQPEEPMKKEGVKDTPQGKSRTILSFKVYLEKQSQLSNKIFNFLFLTFIFLFLFLKDGKPKEKQQHLSQAFINQHTVERKGKQICKYFLERKCIKGDQCKFDHDAEIEKKKEMCKFYVQGYCTRVGLKLFSSLTLVLHEYPCKFYHTGTKCYQGDYCKFSHAPLTPETQELLAKVLDTEKTSCK